MRGATGNNRFVDIRIDRDFFAKIAGGSHPMRTAGLQIDGHADHVAATWFGIAYQSLKFQIGIFSDAPSCTPISSETCPVFLRSATTQ